MRNPIYQWSRLVAVCACLGVVLAGCKAEEEAQSLMLLDDIERDWVFMQINVPEEGEKIESYYYFGEVSTRQFNAIAQNKSQTGFIMLKNTRYWGNDDKIHAYEDYEDTGELVFRIEDVHYIRRMKIEPKVGYGSEQWDEAVDAAEALESNAEQEAEPKSDSAPAASSQIQG